MLTLEVIKLKFNLTIQGMKYSSSDLNYVGKCLALKRASDGKQFLLLFGSDEVSFYVTFIFGKLKDLSYKRKI
jgi:hypothetical protein